MHNAKDQSKLSEMLQLLHILDDEPLPDTGTQHTTPLKVHQAELRIANNIANFVCKSTTDVVCVALDKAMPLTFLLSKSGGPPKEADRFAAAAFFHYMQEAETWRDVMPSMLLYQPDRINRALAALSSFPTEGTLEGNFDDDGIPALLSYTPLELNVEFSEDHSERLAQLFETSDPLVIIRGLFNRVRARSSFRITSQLTVGDALNNLQLLIATSETMLQTRFMHEQLRERTEWAQRYRDLLKNITGYHFGINELIGWRRRFISEDEQIRFAWVPEEPEVDTDAAGDMTVSQLARTAVESVSASLLTYQIITSAEYQNHPVARRLEQRWRCHFPSPSRHVIPRTVSHLDAAYRHYTAWPRVIGSSAPPCVCCARWLTEYNDYYHQRQYPLGARPIQWVTSNPRADVDITVDWAFAASFGTRSNAVADDEVFGMVLERVTDILKRIGLLRRISESDSDSDDGLYEMVTEKTFALLAKTGLVNGDPWRPSPTMGGFTGLPSVDVAEEDMSADVYDTELPPHTSTIQR
ncbi:hypothetical protein FIBSPDRAFT_867221 [Athelia psychrophila]|uniref:Uncharacterized protein n=1 Tax=Athelia psychrophila TaxID=1759441 RepID=A0A166E7J2_9AGAM|nr:hypothetical protein FIBSPDRAFT_867221 [Fibularhizoctonia sp. CBS 109695]